MAKIFKDVLRSLKVQHWRVTSHTISIFTFTLDYIHKLMTTITVQSLARFPITYVTHYLRLTLTSWDSAKHAYSNSNFLENQRDTRKKTFKYGFYTLKEVDFRVQFPLKKVQYITQKCIFSGCIEIWKVTRKWCEAKMAWDEDLTYEQHRAT